MTTPIDDLDALRQRQEDRSISVRINGVYHFDRKVAFEDLRTLLARLDAQQLSQTRLTELLTALGIAPDQHWDHPANVSHAEECAQDQQRLDAVTALPEQWLSAPAVNHIGPLFEAGYSAGIKDCAVSLAAVLTGEARP